MFLWKDIIDNILAGLIQKKKENKLPNKIRNEGRELLQLISQKYNYKRIPWTLICQETGQSRKKLNKFLEIYNLSRINHDKIENINRPITSKEIESVIKNHP